MSEGGFHAHCISTRWWTSDINELNTWAPKVLQAMKALPILRDVATDQQIAGTTATVSIDRGTAQRFQI